MSVQLFVIDKLIRLQMKARFARRPDALILRKMMDAMAKQGRRPPSHVRVEQTTLGGVGVEKLAAAESDPSRAVLYIHGGAFVAGSPATHRALTWRLSEGARAVVYAVDYRLAPEHPYPAGLDDVVAVYRAMLDQGINPKRIVVAGDSAGGNLTLAMALKVKSLGLPQPAALVCMSPATSIGRSLPSHESNQHSDSMFDRRLFANVSSHYCPGADLSDPFLCPLGADVSGLAPTLIHCAQLEMLRDDSVLMAERLDAAGVAVTLEVSPGVFHAWHLMVELLPEAKRAVRDVIAFMNEALSK